MAVTATVEAAVAVAAVAAVEAAVAAVAVAPVKTSKDQRRMNGREGTPRTTRRWSGDMMTARGVEEEEEAAKKRLEMTELNAIKSAEADLVMKLIGK